MGRRLPTGGPGVDGAPLARDSGTLRGKRTVWGGRAPVRAVLYMGTLVATRRSPVIRACYGRLVTAGTPKKVALIAEWVRLNGHSLRYIYPSLLMLAVGFTILVLSAVRTERLACALPAILALLGAIVLVHQPASANRLKRTLDQNFGRMTNEIVSTGATVVAGDYWSVWPAVFHANRARYRLTGRIAVFGLTVRSGHTLSAWRHNGEILLAIPVDDSEGLSLYRGERRCGFLSILGGLSVILA